MKYCQNCGHAIAQQSNKTRHFSTLPAMTLPRHSEIMQSQFVVPLAQALAVSVLASPLFSYLTSDLQAVLAVLSFNTLLVFGLRLSFYSNLYKDKQQEQQQQPQPQPARQVVHRIESTVKRDNATVTRPLNIDDATFQAWRKVAQNWRAGVNFSNSQMVRVTSTATAKQWAELIAYMEAQDMIISNGRQGIEILGTGEQFLAGLLK